MIMTSPELTIGPFPPINWAPTAKNCARDPPRPGPSRRHCSSPARSNSSLRPSRCPAPGFPASPGAADGGDRGIGGDEPVSRALHMRLVHQPDDHVGVGTEVAGELAFLTLVQFLEVLLGMLAGGGGNYCWLGLFFAAHFACSATMAE